MSVRFAPLLGVCLVACTFAAHAAEKRLDRTFSVAPGGQLTIDADAADLRVTGTSGSQVVVHILLKASERALEHMSFGSLAFRSPCGRPVAA